MLATRHHIGEYGEHRTSWMSAKSVAFACIFSIMILIFARHLRRHQVLPLNSPKHWTEFNWPFVGSAIRFFRHRVDMVFEAQKSPTSGAFSILVGGKHVVVLTGDIGRKTFFETKDLNLPQGFVHLLTGKLSAGRDENYGLPYFAKVLQELTRGNMLAERLPLLTDDIRGYCNNLIHQPVSSSGSSMHSIDVFASIPLLMYKLMHRSVGATEIAESPQLLQKTFSQFLQFEGQTSMARIIFPWMITPRYVSQLFTATRLYIVIFNILNRRQRQHKQANDTLQVLLDKGESPRTIVEFVFTVFAAGLTTTTTTSSWLLVFLAYSSQWRQRCSDEVDRVIAAHRRQQQAESYQSGPNEVLESLSLQEWESKFPILGMCLRETIRIALPGAMFRRNVSGNDIHIGTSGEVIPPNAYAAYIVADAHLDPGLYKSPETFDPSRWDVDETSQSQGVGKATTEKQHDYLGWGSGRHLCAGRRLANVHIIMVMVHILANFEFELGGNGQSDGKYEGCMPSPRRNAVRMEVPKQNLNVRFCRRSNMKS